MCTAGAVWIAGHGDDVTIHYNFLIFHRIYVRNFLFQKNLFLNIFHDIFGYFLIFYQIWLICLCGFAFYENIYSLLFVNFISKCPDTICELGSIMCEVCNRSSRISGFGWGISAIRELLCFSVILWLYFIRFYLFMCLELPFWEKSTVPYLSTSTETIYWSNVWFGSIISEVCGRRNNSISGFWWAISAIRELLLLLIFNHCSFSEKPVSLYFFSGFLAIFSHFSGFYWFMCLELPI